MRFLTVIVSLAFSIVGSQPAIATPVPAPQPILFYQMPGALSGDGVDVQDVATRAKVHDRLMAALPPLLGTQLVNVEIGAPSPAKLAAACRAHNAIGAIAVAEAWQVDPSARSVAIVTLTFKNCSGTEWFGVAGHSVREGGQEGLFDQMMDEVIAQAVAQVAQIVHDTPNAASNFVRYGFYMNDAEVDSFWILQVRDQKTFVDNCDPVGTAWRAGLREGDEVLAIDGTPTVGIDTAALNAILENAKRSGPWKLLVRTKSEPARTLTFENESVAWYVDHPASP